MAWDTSTLPWIFVRSVGTGDLRWKFSRRSLGETCREVWCRLEASSVLELREWEEVLWGVDGVVGSLIKEDLHTKNSLSNVSCCSRKCFFYFVTFFLATSGALERSQQWQEAFEVYSQQGSRSPNMYGSMTSAFARQVSWEMASHLQGWSTT